MALCASLSASAWELDRPFAGKELNAELFAGRAEGTTSSVELTLDCAFTVEIDPGEVMYEVDNSTSGV